jgi:iron(III) transport system ATP-binding protein
MTLISHSPPVTQNPADALLVVDGLSHAYAATPVVRELSFTLRAGEIACLLGASGCGKTTVLRLIAGFERPQAGRVVLGGELIADAALQVPPEQRRIGMVFQDYALFPHLTLAQNIGFGLRPSSSIVSSIASSIFGKSALVRRRLGAATMPPKAILQRINEMLDLIGLTAQGNRYPHELSGGQQQRVALARALAPAPHLLLLDEPFSNLDGELRERLSLEVRDILKRAGTAAIMVTHDQHEAFAVADVVGVMREGRIEQWAAPYELYHQPASRAVADFIGQGAFIPGTVVGPDAVEVELGVLHSRLPLDCAQTCVTCQRDCHLDVLLRPDDVVHDDASPVQAEVIAKAFRGADFLYTLRLASGRDVLSLVPSHHNHEIGERIGICLNVDHVVGFRHNAPAH